MINMAEYGIPQRRKRVIFFGVRDDLNIDPRFLVPQKPHNKDSLLLKDRLKFPDLTENCKEFKNHNYHIGDPKRGTKLYV